MTRLTESGQLINKFWELRGELGGYAKAWATAKVWFERRALTQGKDPGQTWKTTSGRAFEHIAVRVIEDQVSTGRLAPLIRVLRWDEIDHRIQRGILAEPVWPKGKITEFEIVESKVDVIALALENERPYRIVSVYSCKSSVAERYQQDLFWAEKIKGRGIKFCFVTIDPGFIRHATTKGGRAGARGKTLPLAQALYDRIYLLTDASIVTDAQVFRAVETVADDLDLWLTAY
jgi:hypothetical protein